jgi:4-diphosphocytidyl-2-C-methyl-D-erythritol kinase
MTVEVLAPAKINLGLEVISKRGDGFHDIATVFQTISVFDRLQISESEDDTVQISNRMEQIDANLVTRALKLARTRGLTDGNWHVELEKRIPVAAGLGGASADAAGTLIALARSEKRDRAALSAVALELGSDVPFLLSGGAALGSGRGDVLERLPPLGGCWLVLTAPLVEIDRKTARLFGSLETFDFSDGSRVNRVALALQRLRPLDPLDLFNAFERPLSVLMPEVDLIREAMLRAGAPFVALSGAGPTQFTILPVLSAAIRIANVLQRECPVSMRVMIARPVGSGPLVRPGKTIDTAKTL